MDSFGQRWLKLTTARKTTAILMLVAALAMAMSRVFAASLAVSSTLWVVSLGLVVGSAVFMLRRG
jgi:hypothetical protein